jgi:hypothetical protein
MAKQAVAERTCSSTHNHARELILEHRRAFDAWLDASRAEDVPANEKTPALKSSLKNAIEQLDRTLSNVLQYRPETLYEASLIAEHLLPHLKLGHFGEPDEFEKFLLSVAVSRVDAPRADDVSSAPALSDPALEAVRSLKEAMAENDKLAAIEADKQGDHTLETEMLLQCGSRWGAQLEAMVATVPITPAGLAAQAELLLHMETEWGDAGEIVRNKDWLIFAKTVSLAAAGLGGI